MIDYSFDALPSMGTVTRPGQSSQGQPINTMGTENIITESVLSNGHIYPEFLPVGHSYVNEWGKCVSVVSHRTIEPMTPEEEIRDLYEKMYDL